MKFWQSKLIFFKQNVYSEQLACFWIFETLFLYVCIFLILWSAKLQKIFVYSFWEKIHPAINQKRVCLCIRDLRVYCVNYSIVKDSSADIGVNSKIVQIRSTVKAVSTKSSNNFFCIFLNILMFLRENKEAQFFLFWIFKLKQP